MTRPWLLAWILVLGFGLACAGTSRDGRRGKRRAPDAGSDSFTCPSGSTRSSGVSPDKGAPTFAVALPVLKTTSDDGPFRYAPPDSGGLATLGVIRGDSLRWCVRDGRIDGPYRAERQDGDTRFVIDGRFVSGKPDGAWEATRYIGDEGSRAWAGTFRDGAPHGSWVLNCGAGCMVEELARGQMKAGEPDGSWAYADEGLEATASYRGGALEGPWTSRFSGGIEVGAFRGGARAGTWILEHGGERTKTTYGDDGADRAPRTPRRR